MKHHETTETSRCQAGSSRIVWLWQSVKAKDCISPSTSVDVKAWQIHRFTTNRTVHSENNFENLWCFKASRLQDYRDLQRSTECFGTAPGSRTLLSSSDKLAGKHIACGVCRTPNAKSAGGSSSWPKTKKQRDPIFIKGNLHASYLLAKQVSLMFVSCRWRFRWLSFTLTVFCKPTLPWQACDTVRTHKRHG